MDIADAALDLHPLAVEDSREQSRQSDLRGIQRQMGLPFAPHSIADDDRCVVARTCHAHDVDRIPGMDGKNGARGNRHEHAA